MPHGHVGPRLVAVMLCGQGEAPARGSGCWRHRRSAPGRPHAGAAVDRARLRVAALCLERVRARVAAVARALVGAAAALAAGAALLDAVLDAGGPRAPRADLAVDWGRGRVACREARREARGAPSSSDAPSGRGTRTIRAGRRPVSAKSAPPSAVAPPSVALLACARGTGGARGQLGQGNRRRARSGSVWRVRRTIVAEKQPPRRFFSRRQFGRRDSTKRARVRKKMLSLLLSIHLLPLLLLPPARLTIASHNIFLRTLKRGWRRFLD